MKVYLTSLILVILIAVTACNKENEPNPEPETTFPEIVKLTSDKDSIKFGGEDPAIITCETTGGEITYLWEVDLGDIFVLNESGSQVRFTGSECCIGEKIITCTATNDKGSVSQTITIFIEAPSVK